MSNKGMDDSSTSAWLLGEQIEVSREFFPGDLSEIHDVCEEEDILEDK